MGKALVARLIIRNLACISLVSLTVTASLNRIRSPLLSNSNRKTLPLILTRDSYKKPSFYGVRGSTAAEFVVSAGLDSEKNAVRINRRERQTRNVEKEGFQGFLIPQQQEQRQISEQGSGVSRKRKRLYGDNRYLRTVSNTMILDDIFKRPRYKRDLQSSASNKTTRSVFTYIHPDDEKFSTNSTNEERSQKKLSLNLMSIIAQADNSSRKAEVQYTSSDDDITKSKLTNITAPILRHLVLSHLVETLMKMKNVSSSHNDFNDTSMRTFNEDFHDADDILTPAEQKQYGIIVNPYGDISSVIMDSGSAPAVRVLRGKLIPLPEVPPELVPIILGTYNPTYINSDDPKLTAGMIDSALSTLLQHEDLLNIEHLTSQIQSLPIGGKVATRKSPSTNHIGSVKSSEPNLVLNAYRPTVDYMPDWRPGPRCDRLTEEICLDDSDYPSSAIMSSIYKDKARFDLMYAEVKERESQVDGLSRKQEQQYTFDHYFGATSPGAATVHPVDYGPRGGFVCPSEVHYARPHRAKNRKGVWKVVVNVAEYTQTLRMEKCLSAGNPCKYVVSHMQSSCSQVYNYHRLLVFNKDQGLHIDAFRVPSACACHIRGHNHRYSQPHPYRGNYEDYTGHVESSPSIVSESVSSNKKKKNNFSNTLWAILGGGQQAGSLAQSPQFLDEVRKQISWTQQVKHFPQLMKHVSPYQVLRQLLDEDDEDDERMVTRRQPNRQIHRYKIEQLPHGAFATSHVPVSVAVRDSPIPVMPSEQINRLPVADGKQLFTVGSNPKTAFSPPGNQKTIFALPDNPSIITQAQDKVSLLVEPSSIAFKIPPGMHLPGNGKIQISEDQLVPVAPQFSDTNIKDSPFRPVLKPMPAPKSSKTKIIEDEDLIAVEKSSGETSLHAFLAEAASKVNEKDERDHNSKINFSYHPILEYLSL